MAENAEPGMDQGGIVDTSIGYEHITQGTAESGVFRIVGGYVDDEGKLHDEVQLRAMTGNEEDILGNNAIPITIRLGTVMAACTQRIGDIVDRGQISKAVNGLPSGARTHLMICLRRTTHWRTEKDRYTMSITCPYLKCEKLADYDVDLASLEIFPMPDPLKRVYTVDLGADRSARWRIATGAQDQIHTVVTENIESEGEILTYSIMTRLISLNGEDCELGVSDFLAENHKKLVLSRRAQQVKAWIKNLGASERDQIRADFIDKEPGIDTDIEVDCKFCNRPIQTRLDVGQRSFFFPSATRMRSKKRHSI